MSQSKFFKNNSLQKIIFTFLVGSIAFFAFSAHAQTTYGSGSSRPWLLSPSASAREAKRFTLQEWLENKERRALMDMWLSLNTPTPYEFILSGSLQSYSADTTTTGITVSNSVSNYRGDVSAFARFVGLTLEHQNNTEEGFNDTTGIFNLRLFGDSQQSSFIALHYGLRTRLANDSSYRLNQQFPGVTLQLYLMKYFGIQGNYRSFNSVTEDFYGETSGDELTYGAYIEYGLLRVFGDVYQERQKSNLNGVETDLDRSGSRIGIKLFF